MKISVIFGVAQTALGYQFFDSGGALLGSRVVTGIIALPEIGSYLASVVKPSGAVGVYWNDTVSGFEALEVFAEEVSLSSEAQDELAAKLDDSVKNKLNQILLAVSLLKPDVVTVVKKVNVSAVSGFPVGAQNDKTKWPY